MAPTQTATKTLSSLVRGKGDGGMHYSIGIAGIKVVKTPDTVRTVLGSCIGIALYDRAAKVGGLAHVILPNSSEGRGDPAKFADTAVDLLLEKLIDAGGEKKYITAKIVGGAAMFGKQEAGGLGQRNAEAVQERLKHHAIRLTACVIGGTKGRKIRLDAQNGEVEVIRIGEEPETI